MTAEEYYQQGNDYRRRGDWQNAMNSYMEAIESVSYKQLTRPMKR